MKIFNKIKSKTSMILPRSELQYWTNCFIQSDMLLFKAICQLSRQALRIDNIKRISPICNWTNGLMWFARLLYSQGNLLMYVLDNQLGNIIWLVYWLSLIFFKIRKSEFWFHGHKVLKRLRDSFEIVALIFYFFLLRIFPVSAACAARCGSFFVKSKLCSQKLWVVTKLIRPLSADVTLMSFQLLIF